MKRYVKEMTNDFIVKTKELGVSELYITKMDRILKSYEKGMIRELDAIQDVLKTYHSAIEEHWKLN